MAARVLGHVRWTTWDALPVALVLAHGALLLAWPSIPLIAVGLWWNANTISHQFIHRPFFRRRVLNSIFSCYLSLLLGLPQSLWRARHLAHHRAIEGRRDRQDMRVAPLDFGAVMALWGGLLIFAPGFALAVYLPGFLIGLGLCYLQGHYEHSRGTVSHYGWSYNFLFFNDGYHAEHHGRPAAHWRELPGQRAKQVAASRWPPVLRWLELVDLCSLERVVLRFPALQRFVLKRHERAFRRLLREAPAFQRVGIVGGGLFPRTALILRRLLSGSRLVLIDQSAANLTVARSFLSGEVEFINERFEPGKPCDFDLLVIPLAFEGDRPAIYRRPPASVVLVHDWIWRRRGASAVVSWLLLKRLNLVTR
ncbi:MAG TPA: fatty acid desaturase [Blastocatellia bacterium]|nr:fatty acid desaturase [Blastocatellia bacterium]